jgi:hypothetical protein
MKSILFFNEKGLRDKLYPAINESKRVVLGYAFFSDKLKEFQLIHGISYL